jgi:nucleoside-diphosphate-sugar epimerase
VPETTSWTGKRILITGATGFIGGYLVRQLQNRGAEVYTGASPGTETRLGSHSLTFDVRDPDSVKEGVERIDPDVVFHLAAAGVTNPAIDPMLALMVNAGGVVHLLEALRESDVERIVLVGTSHEYGAREATEGLDPFSAYAASKVAAWAYGRMYWRAYGLPIVTVRPFQVYGPGQPQGTLIPAAVSAALRGQDFPMTRGEQELDFVYVEDVAQGMTAAAEAPQVEGKSLDLGTGVPCSLRSIVDQIWKITDAKGKIRAGALPYRSGGPMHLVANARRTAQLTGWRATTTLEEGLCTTIQSVTQEG